MRPRARRRRGSPPSDSCSGIFEIKIASSNNPDGVERRLFDALATLKATLNPIELRLASALSSDSYTPEASFDTDEEEVHVGRQLQKLGVLGERRFRDRSELDTYHLLILDDLAYVTSGAPLAWV